VWRPLKRLTVSISCIGLSPPQVSISGIALF